MVFVFSSLLYRPPSKNSILVRKGCGWFFLAHFPLGFLTNWQEFYGKRPLGASLKQLDAFCLKDSALDFSPSLCTTPRNRFKKIKIERKRERDEYSKWFPGLEVGLKMPGRLSYSQKGKNITAQKKIIILGHTFLVLLRGRIELPEMVRV